MDRNGCQKSKSIRATAYWFHPVITGNLLPVRPVAFRRSFVCRNSPTLFSDDKPDRFFTVIKFWLDETSGVALALKTSVPSYQVEEVQGRLLESRVNGANLVS
jgi:inner membrane protein involved in colicin E2 resistance